MAKVLGITGFLLLFLSACKGPIKPLLTPTVTDNPTVVGAFFAISTGNVDRLTTWYLENLGFHIDRINTLANGVKGAILSRSGALLEILQLPAAKPRNAWGLPEEPEAVHGILKIGFEVTDLDLLFTKARERRLDIFFEPIRPPGSALRTFGLRDPDGNIVQFFGK
jgi:hypothetical protein